MLQSLILITNSPDQQARLNLAAIYSLVGLTKSTTEVLIYSNPDTSIGIDLIRALHTFFATKPTTGDHKTAIFLYADHLTREAQHAFLKTLEEPPEFAQIILITHHTHHLLPTILSRCQIVSTSTAAPASAIASETLALVNKLPGLPPGHKLSLSDSYNIDKTKALDLTQELIHHYRNKLHSHPGPRSLYNLTLTLYTTKLLNQNTNPKLSLDHLFLHLK